METSQVVDIAREAFVAFLRAGLPVMLVGLAVGLVISLLQALTQIQEQTLVYIPKIVAVMAALFFFLPFMGEALGAFMQRIAQMIVAAG